MDDPPPPPPRAGMPRWLLYGLVAKLALVVLVTAAIVVYAAS